jgi:hypothetical protein
MPPPPPRIKGRIRSASNPEGMEKWDSYSYSSSSYASAISASAEYSSWSLLSSLPNPTTSTSLSTSTLLSSSTSAWNTNHNDRRHFVLPTSILEEELAEANETCKMHAEQKQMKEMSYFSNVNSNGNGNSKVNSKVNGTPTATPSITASSCPSSSFAPSMKRGMTVFSVLPQQQQQQQQQQHSQQHSQQQLSDEDVEMYGTSPTTVISSIPSNATGNGVGTNTGGKMKKVSTKKKKKKSSTSASRKNDKNNIRKHKNSNSNNNSSHNSSSSSSEEEDDKSSSSTAKATTGTTSVTAPASTETEANNMEDESNVEPAELLRRARNKLFEDLSCSENCGLEKGVVPLPHSLDKYKEVYNKNGRIGIYTPAERAAIIAKFNSKRTRRVWNKKIRYNCRKSLADRRMRVKGRFVKRAVEQENANSKNTNKDVNGNDNSSGQQKKRQKDEKKVVVQKQQKKQHRKKAEHAQVNGAITDSSGGTSSASSSRTASPVPSAPPSGPLAPVQEDDFVEDDTDTDVEMPDVNDPEAGFKPTSTQPYRRTRRHTIT